MRSYAPCIIALLILLMGSFSFGIVSGLDHYDMPTRNTTYHSLESVWGSFVGSQGDQAGGVNRGAGDVNGDGFDDIIVSARYAGKAGEVYLIFGRGAGMPNGAPLSQADVVFTAENTNSFLGHGAGAGDVNGDGYDDILMADIEYSSEGVTGRGKSYLFLGKPNGWDSRYSVSQSNASWIGERMDDSAGFLSTGVGDVNGDGLDDIMLGAHSYDSQTLEDCGKVYMIFGKATGWMNEVPLDDSFVSYYGEYNWQYMGRPGAGAGVGDVNGDGYDDIVVSGFNITDNNGRDYLEKTYLILGSTNRWSKNVSIADHCDTYFLGKDFDDRASILGGRGDVNNDGFDDILIGAYYTSVGKGAVYLFYGGEDIWERGTKVTTADRIYTTSGDHSFGESVAILGDVNGDGIDDMALGARLYDYVYSDQGGAFVIYGNTSSWNGSLDVEKAADVIFYGEWQDHESCGVNMLVWTGDINGDGYNDLQLGARSYWTANNRDAGKAYICLINRAAQQTDTDSVKLYGDDSYTEQISSVMIGDRIFVELNGTDGDSTHRDQAFVQVRSEGMEKELPLMLMETGENTGRYIGNFTLGSNIDTFRRIHDTEPWKYLTVYAKKDPSINATIYVESWLDISIDMPFETANETELYFADFDFRGISTPSEWIVDLGGAEDWLSWNQEELNLSGTPYNQHVDDYDISIEARDLLGHSNEFIYTLEVNNLAPTILTEDILSINETEPYYVDYDSDQDGMGDIKWSLETNSYFLSINATTGELFGSPPKDSYGEFTVTVIVDDGNSGLDHSSFTLTVINLNDDPIISGDDVLEAYEDELYFVKYGYYDADPMDTVDWDFDTNATWLTFDKFNGDLSGVPRNNDVGEHFVNLTVFDDKGGMGHRNFTITVLNTNDEPYWVEVSEDVIMDQGDTYEFDFLAKDPDMGDSLIYSVTSIPQIDISIEKTTGEIVWAPDLWGVKQNTLVGYLFAISVTASDGSISIQHEFSIEILGDPHPVSELVSPDDEASIPISDVLLEWKGSDPEGDPVSFELFFGKDKNRVGSFERDLMVIGPTDNTTFIPQDLERGEIYYWTVLPLDPYSYGSCLSGVRSFHVNTPPFINPVKDQSIEVGEELFLTVVGYDMDDMDMGRVKFQLEEAPSSMEIGERSGEITWVPGVEDVGENVINVSITDGKESRSISFNVTVPEDQEVIDDDTADTDPPYFLIFGILILIVITLLVFFGIFYFLRGSGDRSKSEDKGSDEKEEEPVEDDEEPQEDEIEKEDEYASIYGDLPSTEEVESPPDNEDGKEE